MRMFDMNIDMSSKLLIKSLEMLLSHASVTYFALMVYMAGKQKYIVDIEIDNHVFYHIGVVVG